MRTPTHFLQLASAAAISLAMSSALAANHAIAPDMDNSTALNQLLQAQIAVTWHEDAEGLAKLLATRLDVPFERSNSAAAAKVEVQQGDTETVADALASINSQLPPDNQLHLVQTDAGIRLQFGTQLTAPPGSAQAFPVTTANTASAAPQPGTPTPAPTWQASPADGTLLTTLTKWADEAGWQVVWEAQDDLIIPANATFQGDFRDAVRALFRSFSTSLDPIFYTRNNVVRVTDLGSRTGQPQQR